MKSFSAVDKKGRRPSEIEMMKKQLKKVPGSDSEDEKVRTQVCMIVEKSQLFRLQL